MFPRAIDIVLLLGSTPGKECLHIIPKKQFVTENTPSQDHNGHGGTSR